MLPVTRSVVPVRTRAIYIAGNAGNGIVIRNAGSDNNIIEGNRIGLSLDGLTKIANGIHGVMVIDSASNNTIGGTAPGAGNIISGSVLDGIYIADAGTPPRPKSLRLYNFGSPRVGNDAFCKRFSTLQNDGKIDEAYRIVNGEDVVARNPRTIILPGVGNIGYDHCGATVLISEGGKADPILWVEGESDDEKCPVRDSFSGFESPLSQGTLLADLYNATQRSLGSNGGDDKESNVFEFASKLRNTAGEVADRLSKVSATDIASVVGISRDFTDRELRIVKSFFSGDAINHHMEDTYYGGMGRAAGFVARVGETIEAADVTEVSQD